jgi:hypothetical protein
MQLNQQAQRELQRHQDSHKTWALQNPLQAEQRYTESPHQIVPQELKKELQTRHTDRSFQVQPLGQPQLQRSRQPFQEQSLVPLQKPSHMRQTSQLLSPIRPPTPRQEPWRFRQSAQLRDMLLPAQLAQQIEPQVHQPRQLPQNATLLEQELVYLRGLEHHASKMEGEDVQRAQSHQLHCQPQGQAQLVAGIYKPRNRVYRLPPRRVEMQLPGARATAIRKPLHPFLANSDLACHNGASAALNHAPSQTADMASPVTPASAPLNGIAPDHIFPPERAWSSQMQSYFAEGVRQGVGDSILDELNAIGDGAQGSNYQDGRDHRATREATRKAREVRNGSKIRRALLAEVADPASGLFGNVSSRGSSVPLSRGNDMTVDVPQDASTVAVPESTTLASAQLAYIPPQTFYPAPHAVASRLPIPVAEQEFPEVASSVECKADFQTLHSDGAERGAATFDRRVASILRMSEAKRNSDMQRERRLRARLDELQTVRWKNEVEEVNEIESTARQLLDDRVRSGQTSSLERRNLRGRMHSLSYNAERQLGVLGKRTAAFGPALAPVRSALERNPSSRLDIDKLDHLALIMISVVLDHDDSPTPEGVARSDLVTRVNSEIVQTTAELDRAHQASCEEIAKDAL